MVHCVWCSLVVLKAWPWLRGSSWTPHEGLGLGLDTSGLVLGRGLERKVLALALARPRPRLFHTIQATWLLYVYALLKLTVSHDSLPFLV